MRQKKTIYIYTLVILILLNLTGCISLQNNNNQNIDNSSKINSNIALLKNLENKDISKVENTIASIQSQLSSPNIPIYKKNNSLKTKYKSVFSSTVFMGDSQAEPLSLYGFLEPTSVVAKKGRNVISAKDDIQAVVKLNPKKIVLLYGVNDLLLFKSTEDFITKYERLISSLKKQLPNAQIYVNSVYNVQTFACEKKPLFKRSDDFNKALEKLCTKLSVTYIDSNVLISNDSEYYAPDGIHFLSSYYSPWLQFIQKKLNL